MGKRKNRPKQDILGIHPTKEGIEQGYVSSQFSDFIKMTCSSFVEVTPIPPDACTCSLNKKLIDQLNNQLRYMRKICSKEKPPRQHYFSSNELNIWLVVTSDQLTAMLDEVQKSNVFTFDFENHSMTKKIEITQICIEHGNQIRTYIIKYRKLMDLEKKKIFYDLFLDPNIKKYGFGIEGDIRKLTDDVPVEKSTSWKLLLEIIIKFLGTN